MGEKSAEFEAIRDTFVLLDDILLETEHQRAEEKASYARRWMSDADTTDADRRNRKKAEEIVNRAIEAWEVWTVFCRYGTYIPRSKFMLLGTFVDSVRRTAFLSRS